MELAVAGLSGGVELQRDAADLQFGILALDRVAVGEDQRLFVQRAGLTTADLSATALEAGCQRRGMLSDDEERAATKQPEQKLRSKRHTQRDTTVQKLRSATSTVSARIRSSNSGSNERSCA